MTRPRDVAARLNQARTNLARRGQDHALKWWNDLNPAQQEELLTDIESIPWPAIDAVMDTHIRANAVSAALPSTPLSPPLVRGEASVDSPPSGRGEATVDPLHENRNCYKRAPVLASHADLAPAPVYPANPGPDQRRHYEAARTKGIELLQSGKVAAFTVAGGQGTRLGVSGPKGMVAVTPVKSKTLFQLFAEMTLAARRRYGAAIPWYIMTSPANHEATHTYLSEHSYFGLPAQDVILFPQGTLPAFDFSGRLLMDARHRLSLGPDGHGGSLKALVQSGALADMRKRGITMISYFQVDNPLVKPFDPLFLGLHVGTKSEMSTKIARKAHDFEKVGNLCLKGGKVKVIEYSEMPEELATQKNSDGSRKFDAANLAMHLLDVGFVDRVTGQAVGLPLRRAEKAISYVNDKGERVQPSAPNAVKLETFVFDVLSMARNPLILEVDRAEEFSPVKNATGPDSLETSHSDQMERACRWLERAGITIPGRPDHSCGIKVEISPLFALDADEVAAKASEITPIREGAATYIE